MVGTPSVYASCSISAYSPLPNETNYKWQAVTAPLLIELTDFDTSNCFIPALAVPASGGQAAGVTLDASSVGVVHRLSGMNVGLSTPAYPVNYYILCAVGVPMRRAGLHTDRCP